MTTKVKQDKIMIDAILPFTEEDKLGATGERIVADRYLMKDTKKETLKIDSVVVAVLDKKKSYHELAKVTDIGNEDVEIELRDGHKTRIPFDQIDVLLETSPREMWKRIAKGVASPLKDKEKWEENFYKLQSNWKYVGGGRINASMGTGIKTTSYNCFVIPNVGSLMRDYAVSFAQSLEIQARSGGVGMNLSQVPPQGTLVPVKEVQKTDLNLVLDVWHGDLLDFLDEDYKNSTKIVRINQDFDDAVKNDEEWTFTFPDTSFENYDNVWDGDLKKWIKNGFPTVNGDTVKAKDIYEKIKQSDAIMVYTPYGTEVNVGDSRNSIAMALADMWEEMEKGNQVNAILSTLRPRYSYVRGVNGRSSGAYSWGQLYDKGNYVFANGFGPVGVGEIMSVGCQLTLQGGSRRGALMLILNDKHADIFKFIKCKQVEGVITGANLSVGISEEFMEARKRGKKWEIGFVPTDQIDFFNGDFNYWVSSGQKFIITETVDAEKLWDEMMVSAWKSAEPGVVFLGRYNQMSNSYYFNPVIATNPCGEQGLPAYGICNLGAVVLNKFVNGFADSGSKTVFKNKDKEAYIRSELKKQFDNDMVEFLLSHIKWEELEETTRIGLRFQDAVIDATYYPFEENKKNQMAERRVGLGVMGLHDMMLYCGIKYGTEESTRFIDVLMGLMAEWCYLESVELAKENGAFPLFDAAKFLDSGYMKHMAIHKPHVTSAIQKYGVRNVTTMTIAPTGTTGTMIGCSTGCEPYYAWSYFRNSRLGLFEEKASIVQEYFDTHPNESELPDYFVTSMDLTPEEHVRVQAAMQKWIDSSISKTCNAPSSYTVEDTKKLYDLAYELGCKGVTIYRDGSRSEQVLSLDKDPNKNEENNIQEEKRDEGCRCEQEAMFEKKKRPDVLYGATYRKQTPTGMAYITINDDENHVVREIFVNVGKAGSDVYAANEALGRVATLYLAESNNPNKEAKLVKHLNGIGGSGSVGFGNNRVTSVADAVAKALVEHDKTFPLRYMCEPNMNNDSAYSKVNKKSLADYVTGKDYCPNCHEYALVRHGGCNECEACGFSKC